MNVDDSYVPKPLVCGSSGVAGPGARRSPHPVPVSPAIRAQPAKPPNCDAGRFAILEVDALEVGLAVKSAPPEPPNSQTWSGMNRIFSGPPGHVVTVERTPLGDSA